MSHRVKGMYTVFERPSVYRRFQALLGGPRAVRQFVEEYVAPGEGMSLLDVGCGVGSLLEYLPDSIEYVGFDMNPAYVAAARRRYGGRGRFFCSRVGDEAAELEHHRFDRVVAVALLHHLDDADAHLLLQSARSLLEPRGTFVSIDAVLHAGQSKLSTLLARLDRGRMVRSPEAYRHLLAANFSAVEGWLRTDLLSVPYSHWIGRGMDIL